MSLILAIVADPNEAAQLATLIQGRLPVDLVQAAEVGEGLLALEDRIPDLILTSPLMSPFDDGVLDEYLRDLGPAGAHVQTLRIPVLSQAPKKTKRLGFSLRRSKPEAPTPDGCEPKVFVDEIEQYLARAAEEKRHAESSDQAPVVVEQDEVSEPVIAEEQWTAAYSEEEPVVSSSWSEPAVEAQPEVEPEIEPEIEPEPEPVAWRADLLDRPPVEETPIYQPAPVAYEEPAIEYESPVEAAAAWEEEEVVSEPAPIEEPIAIEAIAEPTIEVAPVEIEPVAEPVEVEPVVEPIDVAPPMAAVPARPVAADVDEDKATPSFKAALAAIRAAWGKPPRKTDVSISTEESQEPVETEPVVAAAETPTSYEVDMTDVVEVLDEEPIDVDARAAAAAHAAAEAAAENVEVYELSAEPDLSEFQTQVTAPAVAEDTAAASAPAAVPEVNGERRKKGKRTAKGTKTPAPAAAPRQGKAAQNEWGVFDPNQCGFAALVDKLDEVSDEKTKQRQNGTKARVISLS